ncbi:hypothetical protein Tco_0449663 [Tanacetum coccineum]
MLATGRYAQWRSRFLRYIDTRPNGDALRKCILTVLNMTPENKAHYESEKEAIHLILTGIGDEIYSTVDACQTAQEMWEAIERLQQGESLNIQDVKTNLFWEFGQFTSHDGETIESYYTRFYKMMNEMIRNNLTVATMQVNVQFLQQLQPEWSRFVTIVKQQHKLDEVSYHKLFDILKQYQKEERKNFIDDEVNIVGTDMSKITRKPSKTGKHGHKNGRVYKSRKPKVNSQSKKVKIQSTLVNRSQPQKDKTQNSFTLVLQVPKDYTNGPWILNGP